MNFFVLFSHADSVTLLRTTISGIIQQRGRYTCNPKSHSDSETRDSFIQINPVSCSDFKRHVTQRQRLLSIHRSVIFHATRNFTLAFRSLNIIPDFLRPVIHFIYVYFIRFNILYTVVPYSVTIYFSKTKKSYQIIKY